MLSVENLHAGYGRLPVLFGVSLAVGAREAVALMGRNGMGKTTTVRAIMGLLRPSGGTIAWAGRPIAGERPFRIARLGIGVVPEGRQVFPTLSVEENLIATAARGPGRRWTLDAIYALFPRLAERRRQWGRLLSGGEQQMVAIGRALMTDPRLLILDEATEGLAPLVRAEIWSALAALKREGIAILVIDKSAADLARIADRAVVLEKGRVVFEGDPAIACRRIFP